MIIWRCDHLSCSKEKINKMECMWVVPLALLSSALFFFLIFEIHFWNFSAHLCSIFSAMGPPCFSLGQRKSLETHLPNTIVSGTIKCIRIHMHQTALHAVVFEAVVVSLLNKEKVKICSMTNPSIISSNISNTI